MGDYTKLIVHCDVQVNQKELSKAIEELSLGDSAYHCGNVIESVEQSEYSFEKNIIHLTLVGQTKYGHRQEEFLDWLEPFVKKGSGPDDIWAIQINEYVGEPSYRKLYNRIDSL